MAHHSLVWLFGRSRLENCSGLTRCSLSSIYSRLIGSTPELSFKTPKVISFQDQWKVVMFLSIVRKSVKKIADRKLTQRNSIETIIRNLPQNSVKYHWKACLTTPKFIGWLTSNLYVNFHSKMQKKVEILSTGKKNSTASLKNSTHVTAPSVRFSNYVV